MLPEQQRGRQDLELLGELGGTGELHAGDRHPARVSRGSDLEAWVEALKDCDAPGGVLHPARAFLRRGLAQQLSQVEIAPVVEGHGSIVPVGPSHAVAIPQVSRMSRNPDTNRSRWHAG